jgi:O-methyltransferase
MFSKIILKALLPVRKWLVPDPSVEAQFPDFDPEFWPLYHRCRAFTMTSPERLYALYQAVNYVVAREVRGDFVECGVWRGGSAMMIGLALLRHGIRDRKIVLYDTFEGMSDPTERDRNRSGVSAEQLLSDSDRSQTDGIWCVSPLEEVKANLEGTGYPMEKICFVRGKVEETLPSQVPSAICMLRLDTDWYESTRHELLHLYPLLMQGGVLIIDDYGFWQGARKAVDEYFQEPGRAILLHRIDATGRIAIRPGGY